jgi:hypothetical protein
MADVSDVVTALGGFVGSTLYPTTPSGEAASPVAGSPVRIEAGWPLPQALDDAMAAGKTHVSIYPRPTERNTTRFPNTREEIPAPAATYTLTRSGQVLTVGGAAPNPYVAQNLAAFVNGKPYVYGATANQTPAQVAAGLRALIAADLAGTSIAGAAITLPATARIGALRVGTTGAVNREVRRQERQFQITVWAPSDAARTAVAKAIDLALAAITFLDLGDGTRGRILYVGSAYNDFAQKQAIYRRDLIYSVEFPTTITEAAAQMVATQTDVETFAGDPIITTYS